VAVLRQEDVLRLDVAVDDPLLVAEARASATSRRFRGARRRERPAQDDGPEGFALEELDDGEANPVRLADVVDGDDAGVGERGDGDGLALEAGERPGVAREALGRT